MQGPTKREDHRPQKTPRSLPRGTNPSETLGQTDTSVTHHHNVSHFNSGRERRRACQRSLKGTHPMTTLHGTPTRVHKHRSGISTQSLLHLSATRLPDKEPDGLRWPTCGDRMMDGTEGGLCLCKLKIGDKA
ncbi:Hypothetical predicted protein [Pelobates cultripes]|uniref:Uncharacterized protein n=1 Tax=Pelobates cultripes TaxID=61616 RepID=A0AAD1SFV1_PELCU|nr:Hypothetical predicted protein [Pelobates cultripes]